MKLLTHLAQRAVLRSIIDDDEFKLRIIELEQISNRHADGSFFVVRRHNDGDGRRERRFLNPRQPVALQPVLVRRAGF